jgi:dTDP-4-dehydrorhamnose 3,5-epimerase
MTKPTIDGVQLTPLKRFNNPKGNVSHAMKKSDLGFAGFGEAYFTTILPGLIKGWHKHLRMTMNLVVPVGKTRFVLFDDREPSQTRECFFSVELSPENYQRLTIPPGIWTAFKGESEEVSLILNLSSIEYDDAEVLRIGLDDIQHDWS